MLEYSYSRKKIFLFFLFSIIMIVFFGWIFYNSEALALREPRSSYRYRWVGKLFYHNETLIQYSSATLLLIFFLFIIRLIQMFIKKTITFKIQDEKLYKDEKYLIDVNQITSFQLKKVNKNYYVNIFLKNPRILIDNEKNILKKIMFKITNYTEKTPLSLNINFLKSKPEIIIKELKQLIK